jgi:hypothetical protein
MGYGYCYTSISVAEVRGPFMIPGQECNKTSERTWNVSTNTLIKTTVLNKCFSCSILLCTTTTCSDPDRWQSSGKMYTKNIFKVTTVYVNGSGCITQQLSELCRKEGPPISNLDSEYRPEVLNIAHAGTIRQWLFGSSHSFLLGPGSEDNLLYKNSVWAPVINESRICEGSTSRQAVLYGHRCPVHGQQQHRCQSFSFQYIQIFNKATAHVLERRVGTFHVNLLTGLLARSQYAAGTGPAAGPSTDYLCFPLSVGKL